MVDAELGEHDAELLTKRTDGMDRMAALRLEAQPAALSFAIDGHALTAAGAQLAWHGGIEAGVQGGFQRDGIEAAEQALQR